jgi:hypothetical protein
MCSGSPTPLQVYPGEKTGDDVVVETDTVWASSAVVALRVMQLPAPTHQVLWEKPGVKLLAVHVHPQHPAAVHCA